MQILKRFYYLRQDRIIPSFIGSYNGVGNIAIPFTRSTVITCCLPKKGSHVINYKIGNLSTKKTFLCKYRFQSSWQSFFLLFFKAHPHFLIIEIWESRLHTPTFCIGESTLNFSALSLQSQNVIPSA